MEKLDKETAKIISDSSHLADMCKSTGWGITREKIFHKIMELNDITALAEADPQKLMIIIAAKQEAVKILLEWLNDIEGMAKNSTLLKQQFLEKQKEDFIMRFETSE